MATEKDLLDLVPGARVVVSGCEASEHGDNVGCLCALKGSIQTMGRPHQSIFVGTSTWNLEGVAKRACLSEVTFLKREG
jgi:hypothetical protein